ncbi:signal peptide peptidase-like 1 isoform X1 [Physcomitrium patens]|uniref:Signal peptide peptidase-like 3 n=1 Tax=Physcomitrium patens TaxID=3218 RepID=A9T3I0_PHYPA|nr:signal peptide peptidase-like 1 isoform X1 [Physcomitrium patens]XP_024366480.1 signal peptide peptidase-like 1 isoform X1 [Physcomitrium patens]XP_024366481.1 signal peptide peptidase-like 1 isoform X1 [Physcomitrium patens]XP_024366484.1 signal peptide peptidase-like 1 isoform X1 [Physcomitrium patens]XP_024366485.1 signal peptide peptidase-like 1 isoform X1 [Physcomitrium patens]PNR26750.1 hypothetical protein PHYPA_030231 [Physcomitrium patens]|eukprot:XP_024366479.1 signal peptide peptidase-like 1 isoform X1 [Physcomitrella patens]
MELWRLAHLFEPAFLALFVTTVAVVLASAQRALAFEKEGERHRDYGGGASQSEVVVTLDTSQALLIPITCSCSLLIMFYLFSSVSMIVMGFTILSSVFSLGFALAPYVAALNARVGDVVVVNRSWFGPITRSQAVLTVFSVGVVASWMVTGHWLLNNVIGISLCVAFVSHVRLPNIKVCALLLVCLFVYDIFWVFFSEQFFGSNVMVTVASRQTSNPVHTVASSLNMQRFSEVVAKKLDLPLKLIFPRNLFWGASGGAFGGQFLMIGLGDMAIPGMLLSLVLCFDHRKVREYDNEGSFSRGNKYIQFGGFGYAVGMIAALAAGLLSQSAQPALLYLVPSTLGSILCAAWMRGELAELWSGPRPIVTEKTSLMEP